MLTLYRILYFLLSQVLRIISVILPEQLQKWIKIKDQNNFVPDKPQSAVRILFHAASGEIEYVKSVIRDLKSKAPHLEIYVSYSSPSAEKLFSNIQDSVSQFLPLPWDYPSSTKSFLNKVKPDLIIFSRTDFWPELIQQAQKKNIPLIAVSMYTQFSFFQKMWLRFVLAKFKFISAVSEQTTDQLQKLLPESVQIQHLADTRFDQVLHRLSQPSRFIIQTQKKMIVFGSTWPEDEILLMKCMPELIGLGYQIVWCPHDVSKSRIQSLESQLKTYSYDLSSFVGSTQPYIFEKQILILDQIGYLADIYRYSQMAFVGGSFKAKVHSVMEPLCAGNPVIVGPYFKNNPEAVDFLKTDLVQSVLTPNDFITVVISHQNRFQKSDVASLVKTKAGSTEKTVQTILDLLENPS